MAGSGGRFPTPKYPDLLEEVRESTSAVQAQEFDAAVSEELGTRLALWNQRDAEAIGRHVDEIRAALNLEDDLVERLIFGGSVAKHTYIDGVSDVDALVILDPKVTAGDTPSEVREYFLQRLRQHFPNTEIISGSMAVTLNFKDIPIQLVPALRRSPSRLLVPAEDGTRWITTNPRLFSNTLASINRKLNGRLIPTIKLAKALLSEMPRDRRPSGYHLEALAIDVFRGYEGKQITKNMLMHFFAELPRRVLAPTGDRTGQSQYIDDDLGPPNGLKRKIVADSIDRLRRKMVFADTVRSIELWKELLDIAPVESK